MNPKILKEKETVVESLKEKTQNSDAVIVIEYRGLSVSQLQELRRSLSEVGAELGIFKNSLFRRATSALGHDDIQELLVGPNAYVFGSDVFATPKVLFKFARKYDKANIKVGLMEGRTTDVKSLKDLSRLPGRDGVLSMVLSVLQAPVQKLAATLDAVRSQKEANN